MTRTEDATRWGIAWKKFAMRRPKAIHVPPREREGRLASGLRAGARGIDGRGVQGLVRSARDAGARRAPGVRESGTPVGRPDAQPVLRRMGTLLAVHSRLLLCALLLAAAACTAPKPTEPWTGPTSGEGPTEEVSIPSLGVTIRVPAGTEVVHLAGGATFYVTPHARAGRSFSLGTGEPALVHGEAATSRQEKKLAGGNRIRYELRTSHEGSGGAEEFLDGAIVVGQDVFAVHCHDQSETQPHAEWCLEWLATARPVR